ncbi:hypothetical protein QKG26_gp090 [Chelonid alphaherpesvirus 5]|uniref:Uncharacterized protein n=1 Tax=Chelonid alphaherpesvirus 5 TaxID=702736 RepID=V5NWM0_9ALPH|nr:hypothetical protein QKG26_gp090 [Chelonid alphaherpesvirus 5]AHA93376.1 hypothetical protein [Chelonid alphaherpesvirus 5]
MGAKLSRWSSREPENYRRRCPAPPWRHPLADECDERDFRVRAGTVHIPVKMVRQSVTEDQCGPDEIEFEYFDATFTTHFRPRAGSSCRALNRPRLQTKLNCSPKNKPPVTPSLSYCAHCSQLCTQEETNDFSSKSEVSTGCAPALNLQDSEEEGDYANIWES